MEIIDGISLPELPFKMSPFEKVLLFHEYPTTIIHEDERGLPILREWVDCSDDSQIDRYFYFRTTRLLLKKFLLSQIPHNELINQSIDGVVVFEDIQVSDGQKYYTVTSAKSLPVAYKPAADFYFKTSDGVHLESINKHFSLDDVDVIDNFSVIEVKQIANSRKSETIYIRLLQGKGIGYGTANTEYLAKSLLKFDKLYKEVALDHKLGIVRGDVQLSAKKNEELLPYVNTEVYGSIAASYGLLIRPVFSQPTLFGDSDNEQITNKLFTLISRSQRIEDLREEYVLHSDFTIKSYKSLIDEVSSLELNVDFNWVSPAKEESISSNLDYKKAAIISNNLDNLTVESDDKFTVKGKFRAINCDTGYFNFISLGNEKYSGSFDKLIREGSERINFLKIYEITISRLLKKEPGMSSSKIIDVITAFVEDVE